MFSKFASKISSLFSGKRLDNETLENLEELLITSDISYDIVSDLIEKIKAQKFNTETTADEVKEILKTELLNILSPCVSTFDTTTYKPFSIVMIGVNGSGKTSTIGKLANKFSNENKSVAVVACDTFRISATEQLRELISKTGATFISRENAEPSGLAYDGYNQAKSLNKDIVMIDTAGRLSNNSGLMAELQKIIKTIKKIDENAPSKTILVLDGNGGQNSLIQMEKFSQDIKIDGVIITKTEGSSKFGFIISIAKKYKMPIYFITNGEKLTDIHEFNPTNFVNRLLEI